MPAPRWQRRVLNPVTEADLLAFVDDRLPWRRRAEIEEHLARHPDDARRVAADLVLLDEGLGVVGTWVAGHWRETAV